MKKQIEKDGIYYDGSNKLKKYAVMQLSGAVIVTAATKYEAYDKLRAVCPDSFTMHDIYLYN